MGTQKTIRVAAVGLSLGHAGTIGPEKTGYIDNWKQIEGVEVVAYCEQNRPEILDDAGVHHPGANVYTSVDDLIANEDFDMASVVLSPSDVPETCIKLAEAGKHIFIDKQFARTSSDMVPLVKAVRRSGVKTLVMYPMSIHPAMQDLKRMINDGILGRPLDVESRQVYWQVGPGGSDPDRPSYRNETEGGGPLHYVGCYHLELMRFLMGCEVKSVQAMTGRPVGYIEEPLEDVAILALEFENGAYGSLHTAYTKPRGLGPIGYDSALVYRGLDGWANWTPVLGTKMEVNSANPTWSGAPERTFDYELGTFPGYFDSRWIHNWMAQLVEAIRADEEAPLTVEDGLKILQCIDAAYESAHTGRRVEVKYGLE